MYKHLLAQRITRYNGQWYCYLCKSPQPDLEKAKSHLQMAHVEQISDTKQILEFLENSDISSKQYNTLLYNGIVLKNLPYGYFCIICQCPIPTLNHVYEHIKGRKHETNKKATIQKENIIIVQQNSNGKQSLVDVEAMEELVKQLDSFTTIEPTFIPQDQLTKSLNTNGNNLMSDCIQLNNVSQNYFCKICKCWIPSLSHIQEHVRGKNHQILKGPTTKENSKNDPKTSNNSIDDNISTSKEVNTSGIQASICTVDTLINTSIDMSSINYFLPLDVAHINRKDVNLLQDKESTPVLMISPNISQELHESLMTMCLPTKNSKIKQKRALDHYNRIYRLEYLFFEEIMFSCQQWKLERIGYDLSYYIPSTNQSVTCLLCHVEHSCDIQIWYEHVHCSEHINKELVLKENSNLLEHFITKKKNFTHNICYACNEKIDQDVVNINTHINEASHKMNRRKLLTQVKSYYHDLFTKIVDLRYAIQYFACTHCQKRYKMKIEFMDHLYQQHPITILQKNNEGFSFCVTCAILWYNNRSLNLYSKHCLNPIHQYLEKNNDFAIKPLPQEVTELLKCIDKNVTALLEISEDASAKSIKRPIIRDLKRTLESHNFNSIKIRLYGSRHTHLALSNSDIDIYLDFGDECNEVELIKKRGKQIEECLRVENKIWRVERVLENARTPIISLIHISTGLKCDISYMNSLAVENSKFIKALHQSYLPCRKLILFLKKWMQLCKFQGSQQITNYALVWLIIFYLQVEHGMPSVSSLIKSDTKLKIISGWRISTSRTFSIKVPKLPTHKLLLGFFEYYGKFDYMSSVICPLLGEKCDKQLFTLDKESIFPKDMEPYITHLQSPTPEFFRIDSAMCVQDPFVLSFNITRAVQVLTLRSFKKYCKESASILREIAFDR